MQLRPHTEETLLYFNIIASQVYKTPKLTLRKRINYQWVIKLDDNVSEEKLYFKVSKSVRYLLIKQEKSHLKWRNLAGAQAPHRQEQPCAPSVMLRKQKSITQYGVTEI